MTAPSKKSGKAKVAKSPVPPPVAPPINKARVLEIEGKPFDREKIEAELAVEGLVSNLVLTQSYGTNINGEIGITQAVKALRSTLVDVEGGNLRGAETMLYSQAVALNAMFAELARRAAANMGSYMEPTERYMRLALKAQSQCRNTLETLANIKNPPVVFARQANISNGPQQVNNGTATGFETKRAQAPAQACGEIENEPTKLLGETLYGGTDLDTGAARAAARGHQTMETVGAVYGAEERGRQGQS
ncbi:hypothetical protein ACFJGX_11095 [Hydrogenophaga sp. UC242_50]|uniref:hypothetical protein n=1 Tax=unclassified Hydrogenophaga TaxID=2610897 RepID=UPI0036D2D41F